VKILKKRCDLLGSSVLNAVEGKDMQLLPEGLKDSIGRLVMYVSFFQYLAQHSSNFLAKGEYGML
jgi:hypothetical protein